MDYEDVEITAKDKTKIHGWFIRATERLVDVYFLSAVSLPEADWRHFVCGTEGAAATQGKGPTVIFFQENAGNIAHRLQ
eukprot:gene4562-5583_t